MVPRQFVRKDTNNRFLMLSSFLVLLIVAAFRDGSYFHDYSNYVNHIDNFDFSWREFASKEVGFVLISAFSKLFLNSAGVFFFVFAFFSLAVKYYVFKNMRDRFYFSLYIYVCLFFIPHELTQIRVSVAASFFMLAYISILEGRRQFFYMACFMAILFHYSAIFLLPMYFILRRRLYYNVFFMLLPLLGFYFHYIDLLALLIDFFIEYAPGGLSYKLAIYNDFVSSGSMKKINLFNLNFIGFLFLYFLISIPVAVAKLDYSSDREIITIWRLMSVCIFLYLSFSYMAVLSFRVYELLSVPLAISVPCIVHYYVQKSAIKFILLFMFLLFLILNMFTLITF
jgi:hypothetical protein